jgi:hypothetical protein
MAQATQEPLDEVIPRELSKDAKLFNFNTAYITKFFTKTALYLPVAVAESPQGRKTIYKLALREKTLMGLYVFDSRIVMDYYTRTSDKLDYTVTKETPDGRALFAGKGQLKVLDDRVGVGEIIVEFEDEEAAASTATAPTKPKKCTCTRRWYVWSFIATENCTCTGGRPTILD